MDISLVALLVGILALGAARMSRRTGSRDPEGAIAELGWRSEEPTSRFPVRYSGATDGIRWTLSVSPAPRSAMSEQGEDTIWWTSGDVRSEEFLMVIGYAPSSTLDWEGQVGIQDHEQIETVADSLFTQLEHAGSDHLPRARPPAEGWMTGIDEEARQRWPWLTIGAFVASAENVVPDDPRLARVAVKAASAAFAGSVLDDKVAEAFARCQSLIEGADALLRVWVGAPDIRAQLTTLAADREVLVYQSIVGFGVSLAAACRRAVGAGMFQVRARAT